MTEETAAKEAPETTTKGAPVVAATDSPQEAAQAAPPEPGAGTPSQPPVEAEAAGAIEGSTEQPQVNGERAESSAVEPGEPSAQTNGEITALKGHLWALKNAVDARATTAEIRELRSSLGELQRSLAEERPADGATEAAPQPDGTQERVAALGKRLEELSRTVRAAVLPEGIDPTAIPPSVLQEVYERTLTDVYQEMARQFGTGAPRTTRAIMDEVRRASSGMEFFRLVDDRRIEATGLADALRRKLLSPHQVHLTYNEFFRRLSAQVPLFRPQSFGDLVGARTSAYTVGTVASLVEQFEDVKQAQADISTRLDGAEAQVRQVTATGDDRIEQRVQESISRKFAKLEAQAEQPEDVKQAQAAILRKVDELEEEEVRQVIGAVDERIERGVQKSISKRLDELEAQIQQVAAADDRMKGGVQKNISKRLDELEAQIRQVATADDRMKGGVQKSMSKRLDGLEAEIRKSVGTAGDRIARGVQKSVSNRLDGLEAEIRKSVGTADDRMKRGVQKSMSKRLDELEAQIQQVVATVDKLNSINF